MGAHNFEDMAFGKTMSNAYNGAVDSALHEYGHDPYNGTISTTNGFVEYTIPKGLTPNEFYTLVLDYHMDNEAMEIPPIRRKFDYPGEKTYYVKHRKLMQKYNALPYEAKKVIASASQHMHKREACVGIELPAKDQRKMREAQPWLKGKRGRFYMFFGFAAS